MNNRELKFRVYIPDHVKFSYFRLGEFDYSDRYLYQHQYPVQQYTGLQDRDGKEIYEGDIVKYNPDDRTVDREGIIEWSNYYHGWTIRDKQCYPESKYGVFSLACPFMSFNGVEIICHIFENPELLKTNE
jgi:uncharacterized phage protein (TIGR01671 family)